MSLSDLAGRLDLPASTVHGILQTLSAHGMVEQEPGSSRYMLGPAVLRMSSVYLDSLEFRSRAVKWSEELARRSGLAVRSGVLLLDDVIIVARVLRHFVGAWGEPLMRELWPGPERSLGLVLRLAHRL